MASETGEVEAERLRKVRDDPFPTRALTYLKLMGPGFMVTALFVGGATIVTASTLGFSYGMEWLWVAVVGVIAYGGLLWGLTRTTVNTKRDFIELCREEIHPVAAYLVIISLLVANTIFHVTQVYLSASIITAVAGIPLIWSTIVTIIIAVLITLPGQDRSFIKVLGWLMQGMIWFLFLVFLLTFLSIDVDWGEIALGLIPSSIPSGGEAIAVGAFVAATVGVQTFILFSSTVKERGWVDDHLVLGKLESGLNSLIFFLVNFLLLAIFAFTLGEEGIQPQGVVQPAQALEPFAGSFSVAIFLAGIWVAVMSSISMQLTINGQLGHAIMPDRIPLDVSDNRFKLAAAIILIFAFLVPAVGTAPFQFLVYAVSFNALFTPLFVVFLIYLVNQRSLMGDMRGGTTTNVLLIILLAASLVGAGATMIGQFG